MLLAFATLACERDPASNVKIIDRPAGSAATDSAANARAQLPPPPFSSELCNIQPETKTGRSTFAANGPCTFRHTGDVKCREALDDFHTMMLRQGPGEATVAVYLNIEFYKGAGSYDGGQMFLTVQNKNAYYHWGSDSVHTTVAPGLKYVDLHETRLEAEPPNTGTVVVTGRLWCTALDTDRPR
jgi:hypothetical protein